MVNAVSVEEISLTDGRVCYRRRCTGLMQVLAGLKIWREQKPCRKRFHPWKLTKQSCERGS